MINITEEQKAYFQTQDIEFEEVLNKDDLEALLEIIDDAVVENIVTHGDEPDETGIRLQRIYDQIRYVQNAED